MGDAAVMHSSRIRIIVQVPCNKLHTTIDKKNDVNMVSVVIAIFFIIDSFVMQNTLGQLILPLIVIFAKRTFSSS